MPARTPIEQARERCDDECQKADTPATKPRIRLTGEDGNAYCILGRCIDVARRAGWNDAQVKQFTDEAKSGNYDHLIQTTMRFFDVE